MDTPSTPEKPSLLTYHCTACTAILLLSALPLSSFRTRSTLDKPRVLPPTSSVFAESRADNLFPAEWRGTLDDAGPTMVRLADGFDQRVRKTCGRCGSVVGYVVEDGAGAQDGQTYVLEEALVETEALKQRR